MEQEIQQNLFPITNLSIILGHGDRIFGQNRFFEDVELNDIAFIKHEIGNNSNKIDNLEKNEYYGD